MRALLSTLLLQQLNTDVKFYLLGAPSYGTKRRRNPNQSCAWLYPERSAVPAVALVTRPASGSILKAFTKRNNRNKLFVRAGADIFLSPGIILQNFGDPSERFKKKRLKT